jgi:hypothetical protein
MQSTKPVTPDPAKPVKPEVDLKSWVSLGKSVKPARTDRRQKKTWKRARI